jgi:cold shock CspA family protein
MVKETRMEVYVTFRGTESNEALEAFVREQAAHLEHFFERIMTCRVAVERPEARRGGPYHVRIDLRLPGKEIVVSEPPSLHAMLAREEEQEERKAEEIEAPFKDVEFAISEAFRAAGRRLQDEVRRMQGSVKLHEAQPRAKVLRLDPHGDYGFLEAEDGHEIYFHRNSVLDNGWAHLAVGAPVAYVEELGEKGPQATTVRLLRKER